MKILVTGNEGFIGKNLCAYLVSRGHEVEGFEFKENVLPDPSPFDLVIHLGAISSTTETDVELVLKRNFEFTMQLIQVCAQMGVNIQIASSASVYGPGLDGFREDSKCLPKSPYAWSKYMSDRYLIESGLYEKSFPINIQSFRYFNVYGPYEEHKGAQMSPVSMFEKTAKEIGVVKVFEGSDGFKRDFICVSDVCRVHEQMLRTDTSGIFNVGTGNTTSFLEIGKIIAEKYNAKLETIPFPKHLIGQYQEYTCADLTNLNKHCKLDYLTVKEYIDGR